MKIINNLFRISAILLLASPFTSCKEEELVKPNALLSDSSLTFEAKAEESQSFRIASDSDWMIDVDEPWITVDPMSGSNTMDVNVTVEDNYTGGVMNAPRQGTITIMNKRGYKVTTVIYQNGDTYLGVEEYTVTEAVKLEAETKVKIPSATVMAVSKVGLVISDGTTAVYAEGSHDVKCGDKISLNGTVAKLGEFVGIKADEVNVLSTGAVEYPEPVIVETGITSPFKAVTYVKATGTVIGSLFRLADGNNCVILDPVKDIDLSAVNIHKVEILGYYVGNINKQYSFVVCSLKDKGADSTVGKELPYRDDFSWLAPYIEMANSKLPEANKISDCVGAVTSSADGCANLYTTLADNGCNVLGELRSRGYTDLNPAFKTIYLQDAYFKFGAGKKQSGLTLPLFRMEGEQDIVVSFKWCSQMQGDGAIDKTQLVLEIDGPGKVEPASDSDKISKPVSHSQSSGKMFWQDAVFTIKGATTATSISFHPSVFGHDGAQESGYYRYYVDDIEVMLAADAVKANINVEGLDSDLITFEGTPETPYTFKVTSDVDFNVSASANWLHVENGSGLAGETKVVSVTCDPSELSVLRKGEITIKSGVTSKKIQVVQSAAGQELDPFISIKEGNSVKVLGQGAEFAVTVQANTSFDTKIDADWIQLVPSTTAKVEWTPLKFKAAANLTGVARTGTVRFVKGNIESVLTVKQDKFEPSIKVTCSGVNTIAGIGETRKVTIVANIPFKVSAPSWVKFPTTEATAGTYSLDIPFEANAGSARSGEVVLSNDEYSYSVKLPVAQAESNVVFFDDFGWLQPVLDYYSTATGNKIGDTIGKNKDDNAVNIYGNDLKSVAPDALKLAGYEDMNPGLELIYLQDKYLKFSKTGGKNTSIRLPNLAVTSATDVTMDFDHAAMVQGSGTVDDSKVVIVIEGDGEFENGTKCSDILEIDQPKGKYNWSHSSVKIKGVNANTRLVVVMYRVVMAKDESGVYKYTGKYNYTVGGAGRIFLDNIKITK
jgi:hypothetical protein